MSSVSIPSNGSASSSGSGSGSSTTSSGYGSGSRTVYKTNVTLTKKLKDKISE